MKTVWLLLLLPNLLGAQEFKFRKIGTNVVDFTLVYQELANPKSSATWHLKYLAAGTVDGVSLAGRVTLSDTRPMFELDSAGFSSQATSRYGNTGDVLGLASAGRMAANGPISAGQYFMLSPQLRQYFKPVQVKTTYDVRNFHLAPPVGKPLTLVAWPLGNGAYDYGMPIAGNPADVSTSILRVSAAGLSTYTLASGREINAGEVRAYQRQKAAAEEGSGSAQYELGKRYLNGVGTETNLVEAARWLSAARTNGYADAAARLLNAIQK